MKPTSGIVPRPFQFTLRSMLIATAVWAVLLAAVVNFYLPEVIPAAGVGLIVCVLWRYTRAAPSGIVLGLCHAGYLIASSSCLYRDSLGSANGPDGILASSVGLLAGPAAVIAFLINAWTHPFSRKLNLACAAGLIVLIIVWASVMHPLFGQLRELRIADQNLRNKNVLQALFAKVEDVTTQLGHVPASEAELVDHTDAESLWIDRGIRRVKIGYQYDGPQKFRLSFRDHYRFTYHSQYPERGWTKSDDRDNLTICCY